MKTTPTENTYPFLKGGGEMGQLTRTFDWSHTSIGQSDQWPQSLRITVSNILRSKFPMFLWWGEEKIQFYNDAYRPSLGTSGKHPSALGAKGMETWPEIWHIISPLMQQVELTGEATWMEDQLVPIYRNGKIEDVYWTYSYSSVLDDEGNHGGILVTCMETTAAVFGYQKIAKSQQELLQLFDESPVAIAKISKDDDLVFEYANSFYGVVVGRKPEQIVGRPLLEALPEIAGQGFDDLLKEVIRTTKPFVAKEVSFDIVREEKIETRYVDLAYQPRIESNGTVGGVLVVATDVTEQVRSRKIIEEAAARYKTLFESMEQGYCTLEIIFEGERCVNYRYLETNPTFERHLGISNVLGKTILDIAPGIEPKWFGFYGSVALTGKAIRIEEESKAFHKWFEVYAIRIGDAEERKVGVFFTDITERKNREAVLRENETRFRNLIEQAPISICITHGEDMIFETINPSMLQLINKKHKNEVIGKKLTAVLPELEGQRVLDILKNVLQTGETYTGTEVPMNLMNDGVLQSGYFNISYTRIVDSKETPAVLHLAFNVTDKVVARRKTEESEAKLRSILNSAPTAMGVFVGPDLILENPNQLLIEVMAAGPDIEGKSFRKLLSGLVAEDQKFIDLIDTVRATGRSFEAQEVEVIFKVQNKTRYFNVSFIPLRDESGEVYAVLDVSVDVTRQVLARQQIEASENKLQTIISNAPVAMALFRGADYIIEQANQAFIELTGKTRNVVGLALRQAIPDPGGHPFFRLIDEVYKTGVSANASDVMVTVDRNGAPASEYYNLSYDRLIDTQGQAELILAIAVNVTQQFVVRQQLQENEAALETALEQVRLSKEAAELGTFDVDLKKNTMHWDDRCRILFGITHHLPVSYERDFVGGLHTEDRERILKVIEGSFIKSVSDGDYDVEYRTVGAEDGILRWVRAKGKVYFNTDDEPVRFVGSVLDITEKVMAIQKIEGLVEERTMELAYANESLLQANIELQRSNKNLEEFAYAASHDLKEPIRKIHVFADLLKSHLHNKLDDEAIRYFERLQTGANRMSTLIDDLLMYSHISRGVNVLEAVDLNSILSLVEEDLELAIREKGAAIKVERLPTINGHKRQMQQLFENLLGNALKYSKPGVAPEVNIHSKVVYGSDMALQLKPDERAILFHFIEVRDNGIGFDQEHAERIFNVFTRLHDNALYKGTGVGLSIARKVVENHGGYMWAESKPGNGASFKIYLPVDSEQ